MLQDWTWERDRGLRKGYFFGSRVRVKSCEGGEGSDLEEVICVLGGKGPFFLYGREGWRDKNKMEARRKRES